MHPRADPKPRAFVRPLPEHGRRTAFAALATSIVYQQLSGASAAAIHARFAAACGGRVTPARVLALRPAQLRRCGLSRQKASYLRDLAQRFERGAIQPRRFPALPDSAVVAELTAVKGIGRWTAEMFLIFHLGREDVFPAQDLGVQKAVARLYGARSLERLDAFAQRWAPHRSAAALALWAAVDGEPSEDW